MAVRLATANIRYQAQSAHEVVCDVTVKSLGRLDRAFAPTWKMLRDYKQHRITWADYRKLYFGLMKLRYDTDPTPFASVFDTCLQGYIVVFTCYCTGHSMQGPHQCHRYLLVELFERLCLRRTIEFEYLGERR